MSWRAQIDDRGVITRYKDNDTGEVISAKEYERRLQMQQGQYLLAPGSNVPQMTAVPAGYVMAKPRDGGGVYGTMPVAPDPASGMLMSQSGMAAAPLAPSAMAPAGTAPSPYAPIAASPMPAAQQGMIPAGMTPAAQPAAAGGGNPLIQPGAQILSSPNVLAPAGQQAGAPGMPANPAGGHPPTEGMPVQGKNLRMEGIPGHVNSTSIGYKAHGFLDATSIAILLPTLVLLALIIAAAHKKRLFPWQTLRTFSPPSGLMTPREYERSYLCPPNLRRHGRMGKRNPNATWAEQDGVVIPFGFLARTHLPVTIPLGRLPNKNMFVVAPSGSGKTTLMRAIIKALLAKPCVIIALEAKANDPNLDERREGFKYSVLPEAQAAGFNCLYFNPLDSESVHWNPLDLDPITFASSIVQDVNSLPPEEQHWAERDHGYIAGLVTLLKWGAVMVSGEDENGVAAEVQTLPCNPRGLMRLVNNRRNIVESLRRLKSNPNVDPSELSEMTQTLSSIIRTDTDWDKNIQGIRGRLRMFKNPNILRVTDKSNIDMRGSMHEPTVLIFGAPASLGPDAESLAACFVYQLQQALHTRYGTASVLPLFAFFDEYQTLNIDIAGRLSAIVRGANGGLAIILQNISQIMGKEATGDPTSSGGSELKTIFSNSALRVCLHNADESTARFFSDEIGKHAVIVPGISDHYEAKGFGIFPSTWNRIHSQQVVARVDPDAIKRMEKHHALVYLAPAGDPEFGEAKPFMCDLRGIEEIARLHLLHNVNNRNTPPGGPVGSGPVPGAPAGSGGSGPVMPSFVSVGGGSLGSAPAARSGIAARSDRLCPHCGQAAGKGKFCIECGKPVPVAASLAPAGGASAPETSVASVGSAPPDQAALPAGLPGFAGADAPPSAVPAAVAQTPAAASWIATQVTGQVIPPTAAAPAAPPVPPAAEPVVPGAHPAPVRPPMPQFAAGSPGTAAGQKDQPGRAAAPQQPFPTTVAPAAPPARPQPAQRQSMLGSVLAGATPPVMPGYAAQQPQAPPAGAPQADGQAAGAHRRPPVTSLNPDLAKLGLPQAPGQSGQGQRPARSPGGVEF